MSDAKLAGLLDELLNRAHSQERHKTSEAHMYYDTRAVEARLALEHYVASVRDGAFEEAAKVCHDAADRLFSGRVRVPQVDQHVAAVLRAKAFEITALRSSHDRA